VKKLFLLLTVFVLGFVLTGCTEQPEDYCPEGEVYVDGECIEYVAPNPNACEDGEAYVDGECKEYVEPTELAEIPAEVTMDTVDDYLGRPDVQYVDLRNFDDKVKSGYIAGFEFIPFFDVLEATDILVRNTGWDFTSADIVDQTALEGFFDAEKTIFLMCGSGTRAGYVKAALESIGYTNVINVGGIGTYTGDNKVDGDGSYNVEVQLPLPDVVDMTNIDMYLGRSDVQYVDLRNFDDKMKSGYIAGFEFIPFFDYLEYENILVRHTGWDFAAVDILDFEALEGLFSMDKTIFLMCGSGTRAGYVKAALEERGYTNVYNVGGIGTYTGDNKVFGDGSYVLEPAPRGLYLPGVHVGVDEVSGYMVTVTVNDLGAIVDVVFDSMYHGTTKQALGPDYGMRTNTDGWTWAEMANVLADFVVENQGFGDMMFTETAYDPTWNDMTVPHHIIETDVANSPDDVAGVTAGMEGFVFAWNLAISQASDSDLGVVATVVSYDQWVAAHAPAYAYEDGVYYGYESGYSALITIENGFIVDVYLDAIHCRDLDDPADGIEETCNTKRSYTVEEYTMNYVTNDNGTPLDETDDFLELPADTLDWWMMADALGDAVVDYQTWSADWVMTDMAHFDADLGIDEIAGVTISVDKWQAAVEEALTEATPTS